MLQYVFGSPIEFFFEGRYKRFALSRMVRRTESITKRAGIERDYDKARVTEVFPKMVSP
jgi:hypothetical protein